MRKEKEIVEEAIKVTAMLVKENSELKKENEELKFLLRWSWNNAGKVALSKYLSVLPINIPHMRQAIPKPSTSAQIRRLRNLTEAK